MKKTIVVIGALMTLIFTLSGCKTEASDVYVPPEKLFAPEEKMPEPFKYPGAHETIGAFRSRYNFAFSNLDSAILNLADKEERDRWFDEKFKEKLFVPYPDDITVLSFVRRFDIPKEKLIEAVESTDLSEEWIVSPADIEIIYSEDTELTNKTFVSEYALINGGEVYSAEWVYMHSPEDYRNEGLPFDKVYECLDKMEELRFTEEALAAIREKKDYLAAVEESTDMVMSRKPDMPIPFAENEEKPEAFYSDSPDNVYALSCGGRIYTPEWLYEHSVSDYIEEGIPLGIAAERLEKMKGFRFTEKAREALEAKAELVRKIDSFSFETPPREETETVAITEAPETESVSATPAP